MARTNGPVLLGEDDYFTTLIAIVLDPKADPLSKTAFADFFANDLPDFDGWCQRIRDNVGAFYPAEIRTLADESEVAAKIKGAHALIVEAMPVTRQMIDAADSLVAVQRYGTVLRRIDTVACAAKGIKVLTLRRRANVAVAEMAICLMLMLAKKANRLAGRVSADALAEIGYPYKPFDRRFTPNSNYPRVPGIRMLQGSTIGIIGLGEIGREIARRANAFDMRVLYNQRTRLPLVEESELNAQFAPLDQLLAESDWILPQLPSDATTRNLIDRPQFGHMKQGALIVNVSRADVVNRDALIEALKSGRLGGFALDPLYQEPGRSDDELLQFDNVILMPHVASQPRFNMLGDIEEMVYSLAKAIGDK